MDEDQKKPTVEAGEVTGKPTGQVTGEATDELTIEQTLKSLINNPELSDCAFLVGEQRTRIYVHKLVLAMSNPVFKSMFFGELKETKFEIEIPDLHEKGFLNLIR